MAQKVKVLPRDMALNWIEAMPMFLARVDPFEARVLRPKNQWLRYFQASTCSLSSQQYEQDHAARIPYGSISALLSFGHQFYHPQPAVADAVIVNFCRHFFPLKPQRG